SGSPSIYELEAMKGNPPAPRMFWALIFGLGREGGRGLGQIQALFLDGEVHVQVPQHVHADNDLGQGYIVARLSDQAAGFVAVVGVLVDDIRHDNDPWIGDGDAL